MFSGNTSALIKRYRVEIGASSSSVFSTLVAFPLDSVKTRMQTYQYKGFLDCVKHTYRTEKLGGFFRGAFSRGDVETSGSDPGSADILCSRI